MKTFDQMEQDYWKAVRQELIAGVKQCTEAQQQIFKHYGNQSWSVERVVNAMPKSQLRRAFQQVQATLNLNRDEAVPVDYKRGSSQLFK